MAKIQQGDSYAVKIRLKDAHGSAIGTDGVQGIQVKLGSGTEAVTKEYPNGGLTYADGKWSFSLTQAQTYALEGEVAIQAQVYFLNGDVITSPVSTILFTESIISKTWGD